MSDDDDDDDYTPHNKTHHMKTHHMKMPGMMSMFMCTPLKIYLAIALISVIIYYANAVMKGKWPDGNTGSSLCCSIICISLVIMFTCKSNFLVAWALAFIFSICSICFAMGKISIPKLY